MSDQASGAAPARHRYEVVIATRNRPDALTLSVPLLLGQSRPPERLIVVDSSDDHDAVARAVEAAARASRVPVVVERGPRGSSHQRNHGLEHVTADVVMFPDDDSLTHPGACEAILGAFDRDRGGQVAAVCSAASPTPPPGVLEEGTYAVSEEHRLKARLAPLQSRLSAAMPAVSPRISVGSVVVERAPDLPWLEEAGCEVAPWMTGWRNMSFRADVLRHVGGFEEAFGSYALFEDTDASFAVARHGCILSATNALVYHHRFPSGRGGRREMAVMRVLNLAFVLAKHTADLGLDARQAARVRAAMRRHLWLRLAQGRAALLRAGRGGAAEDELRGLREAWPHARALLQDTPRADLARAYARAAGALGVDGVPAPA